MAPRLSWCLGEFSETGEHLNLKRRMRCGVRDTSTKGLDTDMESNTPARRRAFSPARWRALILAFALAGGMAIVPTPTSASAMPATDFIKWVAPMAQQGEREFDVPASVSIAQAILESGWGESTLSKKANSFFGIKCSSKTSPYQDGCYSVTTTEYTADGTKYTTTAKFRKYDSPTDSFRDHGLFLTANSRYAPAFKYPGNPNRFAYEIHKAGYATDPAYTSRLISLMQRYNLYKYDVAPTNNKVLAPSVIGQAGRTADVGDTVTFISTFYADPDPRIYWQASTDGSNWKTIAADANNKIEKYGYRTVLTKKLTSAGKIYLRTRVKSSGGTATTAPVTVTAKAVTFPVKRLQGADRYSTAVAISKDTFATGSRPVAYITWGGAHSLALPAAGAAEKRNGVVLLTGRDSIPSAVATELKRLNPSRIYVIGKPASVSDRVLRKLDSYTTGPVTRITAGSKYAYAANVSKTAFSSATTVIMSSGHNYQNVLSASTWLGRYDAPVLLAPKSGRLTASTIKELRRLGTKRVLLVANTTDVPSSVVYKLRDMGISVKRTHGSTVYRTAMDTARTAFPSSAKVVYLASGADYTDALTAGIMQGKATGPLILIKKPCLTSSTVRYIRSLQPARIVVIGQPEVVPTTTAKLKVCS